MNEWRDPDSNRGHHDFQSCALPTELSRQSPANRQFQTSHQRPFLGPTYPDSWPDGSTKDSAACRRQYFGLNLTGLGMSVRRRELVRVSAGYRASHSARPMAAAVELTIAFDEPDEGWLDRRTRAGGSRSLKPGTLSRGGAGQRPGCVPDGTHAARRARRTDPVRRSRAPAVHRRGVKRRELERQLRAHACTEVGGTKHVKWRGPQGQIFGPPASQRDRCRRGAGRLDL